MLSHSNVFILLILVKHSTFIWFVLATEESANLIENNATLAGLLQKADNQNILRGDGTLVDGPSSIVSTVATASSTSMSSTSTSSIISSSPLTLVRRQDVATNVGGFVEYMAAELQADSAPPIDSAGRLPEFPQRSDAIYFVVAVAGGAKVWGRTLARTLIDMGPPFASPQGPPLRPLYVDLPENGR